MAKGRKAFGGYAISFKGCKDTVEKVFGSGPIGPSVMTKKLWAYVKRQRLRQLLPGPGSSLRGGPTRRGPAFVAARGGPPARLGGVRRGRDGTCVPLVA